MADILVWVGFLTKCSRGATRSVFPAVDGSSISVYVRVASRAHKALLLRDKRIRAAASAAATGL